MHEAPVAAVSWREGCGLFWRQRQTWLDGAIELDGFGHALLEHALSPDKLLVGKALVFLATGDVDVGQMRAACYQPRRADRSYPAAQQLG